MKGKSHQKTELHRRLSFDSDDNEFEICVNTETTKSNHSRIQEEITWPKKDILKLIEKIENDIPEEDFLSFQTRLNKLNWENIKFKNYSVEECQRVWENIQKSVRKFRLLKEITGDIKNNINKIRKRNSRVLSKHPEMPKYPRSAYMHYFLKTKTKLMKENPDTPYSIIIKRIGEMYRNLEPDHRANYEKIASEAFEEYSKKLNIFYEKYPELKPKKESRERVSEDEGESDNELKQLQQKPKTPFELFFENQLEVNKNDSFDKKTFRKKCRDEWTGMVDEEKINWIKRAEKEHTIYLQDITTYSKLYPKIKLKPVQSILNKEEKLLMQQMAGRPIEPPMTGFHIFMQDVGHRGELQNMNIKSIQNYLAEKWSNSTEIERMEYKKRCKRLWDEYNKNLNSYLKTLKPDERDQILNKSRKRKSRKSISNNHKRPKFIPFSGSSEPKKPPDTAYEYFLSFYDDIKGPQIWTKFTNKEKEVYEKKLENAKRKYISDYELYLGELKRAENNKEFVRVTNSHLESASEGEED